jgi:predicted ATPase
MAASCSLAAVVRNDGTEDTNQAAIFATVREVFASSTAGGQSPLVVLLDDLQWADPASLDLLRFIGREIAALPILLIATYRTDELTAEHHLALLLPALVREAHAARLTLRPLEDDAVRVLVHARYALPEGEARRLVAYLQERAEGNPFFIGELTRALEDAGALRATERGWLLENIAGVRVPLLVRQVIAGRLARLEEEARESLAVAAVIGQEVPYGLWATVSGADEATLLAVVERGRMAHTLDEMPDTMGVRFVHALIRMTLYEDIAPSRRREWHRAAGEALAALPTPDPDAVAYHFRQAGDKRAALWLIRAGERAQRSYAWLTAAERFEAVAALPNAPRGDATTHAWLLLRLAWLRGRDDRTRAGVR